jgi:hypothetical protein
MQDFGVEIDTVKNSLEECNDIYWDTHSIIST